MSHNLTMSMINNAALLLVLSIICEVRYLIQIRNKILSHIFTGVLIGLIAIAIMVFSYELIPGVFVDTRTILLCVAALFFGLYPASIAGAITIFYRLLLNGPGLIPGVADIILSIVLGLMFRRLIDLKASKFRWLKLYIFGLIVHIVYLICSFLMPWDIAVSFLRQIAFPMTAIYPIGTVLLSLLLLRQKERNEALFRAAEAESRYRCVFDNDHAVMLLIDPKNGNITNANAAATRFYGWQEAVLNSMNFSQINTLPPEKVRAMTEASANRWSHFTCKHYKASGETVDVEIYSGPIYYCGKKLLFTIIYDVSLRNAALDALQDSEERFRTLVDNAPDAIFVMTNRRITFANKAGINLLGADSADDLIGMPGYKIIHPDYYGVIAQYTNKLKKRHSQSLSSEMICIKLDNTFIYVDVIIAPIKYNNIIGELIFARDITERKRLQEKEQAMEAQLRQQQKLEAIGTLAGGVAHEINNPLNGIMNYAQLILDASDENSGNAFYSREIISETERISEIVKNLLQFSRQEKQSHSYASIYDIINKTLSLINTIIKKDRITLDIQLDEDLPNFKCRSQQIQQVLMNLLTNARDAVNEKYAESDNDKKVISLRCGEYADERGRWLRLTVQDYGNGIPAELRERIFEPFFSTKPKENGTGLGLSITYGIVSEHRGRIRFETECGEYAKFIVDFPVDNGWSLNTQALAAGGIV